MLKVLIVDDEQLSRIELVSMLKRCSCRCTVVGTCENGRQGLEFIEVIQPDVIIADIRMPVMDGLEMVRRLRERDSSVAVVMLTGYAEFQYVQEALRLGAIDYIEKWKLDDEYLTGVLQRARKHLALSSASPIDRCGTNDSTLLQKLRRWERCLELREDHPDLTVADAFAEIRIFSMETGLYASTEWEQTIRSVLQDVLMTYERMGVSGRMVADAPHRYWLMLNLCEQYDKSIVENLINHLRTILKTCLNAEVQCGYAIRSQDLSAVCFRRAVTCCEEAFWTGSLFCTVSSERSSIVQRWDMECLRQCILHADSDALSIWIKNTLRQTMQPPQPTRAAFQDILLRTLNGLESEASSFSAEVLSAHKTAIVASATLGVMMQFFQAACEMFCKQSVSSHADDDALACAYDFICLNYMEPIRLTDVAKEAAMNPAYLSSQFKKRYGYSLVTFRNMLRVKKAKEFLQNTSMTISEISMSVGFNNASYFTKIFRKMTGCQPLAYRHGIREDNNLRKTFMHPKG